MTEIKTEKKGLLDIPKNRRVYKKGQVSNVKRGPKVKTPQVSQIATRDSIDKNLKQWMSGKTTTPDVLRAARLMKNISTLYPTTGSAGAVDYSNNILDRSYNNELKIKVALSVEAIYGWACGVLSYAFKMGYLQSVYENPEYPANAWNFIVSQLLAAANNQLSPNSSKDKIPIAMRDMIAALSPKKGIPFPQGSISYSWEVPNFPTPSDCINYPASSSPTGGSFRLWEVSDTLSNGFTQMVPLSNWSYSAEAGAIAFNDLAGFLQSTSPGKGYSGVNLVNPDFSKSKLYRCPSAFAFSSPVVGDGNLGGAFNSIASLELPRNDSPQTSVFVSGAQKVQNVRTYNNHHCTGGDSNYLAVRQLSSESEDNYKNKLFPIFKPIDIYELIHRYAMVWADIFQKASDDTSIKMQYQNLGMSAAEFAFMIHQQITLLYADTQVAVQSELVYRGATNTQFLPFICDACNTMSNTTEVMMVPYYVNANLQALGPRYLCTTKNPKYGTSVNYNRRRYLPMWGQYVDYSFNGDEYTYLPPGAEAPVPIFTGSSSNDTFNLYTKTLNSIVIDAGNSPRILECVAHQNEIISTYSAYVQGLTAITKEPGASIFEVIGDTLILKEVSGKELTPKQDVRKGKQRISNKSVVLHEKKIVAHTSQKPVIGEVVNNIEDFIRPEVLLFTPTGGASGAITVTSWEALAHEISTGRGGTQTNNSTNLLDLEAARRSYKANCTKNRGGEDCAFIKMVEHFDDTGKGGLLDTLATISGSVLQAFVGTVPLITRAMAV